MKIVDIGAMLVMYNFVIGVLIMLSSEKIAAYAGCLSKARGETITRLTRVSTLAFGACVSVFSGGIYLAFHVMKLGV